MNSRIKKFYSSKKNRFLSKKYSISNKKTIGTNKDNNISRSKRKKYISKVKSSNFSTKKLFRKGIIFSNKKGFSFIPVAYIIGFLITFLLLITSSVDAILSDSLFIIYSGILLIKLPKIYSKGKIMDYTILFFLLFHLLFFLANSYWGTSFTSQGNEIIYSYFEPFYLFSNVSNLIITFSLVAIYYSMNSWSNDSHDKNKLFILFFILSFFLILICYNNISNPLGFLFGNNDNLHQIGFYLENFTLYSTIIGVLGYGHWILSKCKEKIFSLISFILSFLVFYNNPSFFLLH